MILDGSIGVIEALDWSVATVVSSVPRADEEIGGNGGGGGGVDVDVDAEIGPSET